MPKVHETLALDRAVDVVVLPGRRVTFVTPTGAFTLDDPRSLVQRIVALCRDGHDRAGLMASEATPSARAAVGSLLDLLERRRVLVRCAASIESDAGESASVEMGVIVSSPAGPAARSSGPGMDPLGDWIRHYAAGRSPAPGLRVAVFGTGQLSAALRKGLDRLGLNQIEGDRPGADGPTATVQDGAPDGTGSGIASNPADAMDGPPSGPQLWIGSADWPDHDRLRSLNGQAVKQGAAFLPVWIDRATIAWGPLVEPGATGCFDCLFHRMAAADRRPPGQPPRPTPHPGIGVSPMIIDIASGFAAAEVVRWAVDGHVDFEPGIAWSLDMLTLTFQGGRVMRLPRCPACGTPGGHGTGTQGWTPRGVMA